MLGHTEPANRLVTAKSTGVLQQGKTAIGRCDPEAAVWRGSTHARGGAANLNQEGRQPATTHTTAD